MNSYKLTLLICWRPRDRHHCHLTDLFLSNQAPRSKAIGMGRSSGSTINTITYGCAPRACWQYIPIQAPRAMGIGCNCLHSCWKCNSTQGHLSLQRSQVSLKRWAAIWLGWLRFYFYALEFITILKIEIAKLRTLQIHIFRVVYIYMML